MSYIPSFDNEVIEELKLRSSKRKNGFYIYKDFYYVVHNNFLRALTYNYHLFEFYNGYLIYKGHFNDHPRKIIRKILKRGFEY